MKGGMLGFLEMFIVLTFALGWGILELLGLHLDKEREQAKAEETAKAGPNEIDKPMSD